MDFDLKTNEKGNLTIGGADMMELADQYKTPLYVIDENRIKIIIKDFMKHFQVIIMILRCFMHVKPTQILQS